MEGKKTVMVIEDEISIQKLIKRILEFYNYNVKEYITGEEALNDLYEVNPDIILLDVGLPGMSGFECYSEIVKKTKEANIPTVFITGRTYDIEIKKRLETGRVDFLTKPFDPLTLKEIIERRLKEPGKIKSNKKEE